VNTQRLGKLNVLRHLPAHPDISSHLNDYFPDSRAEDEAFFRQWIHSGNPAELVLCVLGKAGLGKSTLAKQVATKLRQDDQLAAAIFFSFALPDWSPEAVIRMIAAQLCRVYPALTQAIFKAIRLDVVPSVSLEDRIHNFLVAPIKSLRLDHPLVVVLDALDQWAAHPVLVKALSCLVTEAHLIRFIVLGRPGLEGCFRNLCFRRYDLHSLSARVMPEDFTPDEESNDAVGHIEATLRNMKICAPDVDDVLC
jgi:NACHT domain